MKESENIERVNWDLMASFLCGEAGPEEKAEMEAWAGLSQENRSELESSGKLMEKSRLFYHTARFNATPAWEKVEQRLGTPGEKQPTAVGHSIKEFRIRLLKVAASVLLAILLGTAGFYLGFRQHKTTIYTEVVSNDRQVLNSITLPDGTHVTLNNSSKLVYPNEFTGETREVSIEGEAFFEVEHNPSKPFVISAGKANIRVLGTSFNVNARPGVATVEVVVSTGKVQVACGQQVAEPCSDLVLMPGERGILFNDNYHLEKSFNDDPNVISWKTHDLVFNETKLAEVIINLEKVYHSEIQLSDPHVGDLLLTAHFKDQTIDFILEVIRLTFNLDLSADNGQYFLTARSQPISKSHENN